MTAVTAPAVAEPRARFRDLLAAEWLKFRSLRWPRWALLAGGLVILGLDAGQAYEHYHYWHANGLTPAQSSPRGCRSWTPSPRTRASPW